MQVTLIVARFFDNTQGFVRAVAQHAGAPVVLLRGDENFERGARAIRFSHRVWFEGFGPLLAQLLEAPRSWRLPRACLRVGEDEIDRLPLRDLRAVISDLMVPTWSAALAVADAGGLDAADGTFMRVHCLEADLRRYILGQVAPGEDVTRLVRLLLKAPADLARSAWRSIGLVGEACRRRVLLAGQAPDELKVHLTEACGLAVVDDDPDDASPVDSIVMWQENPVDLSAAVPERCLSRLSQGGTVVCVSPEAPSRRDGDAGIRVLEAPVAAPAQGASSAAGAGGMPAPPLRGHVPGETSSMPSDVGRGNAPATQLAKRPGCRGRAPAYTLLVAPARPSGVAPAAKAAPDETLRPVRVKAQPPFVSVVVPVYNDADRVDVALWSLRRQTYRDLEILVVDDGSTDGTAQAVAKHLNDRRVRYLYKRHSGRPETRNLGVREARGAYVAWLGSDDESLPNRILKQVEAVRKDPAVDIVHTDGLIFRPDGTLYERRRYQAFTAEDLPRLLMAGFSSICPILDTSAMIRRSLYDRIGPYDPAFLRCQDYDFYIRTAMAGDVRYCHVPLALVKVHQNPPTPEKSALMLDFYTRLALGMIESFGPERLTGPAARDLHIPSCLAMAEYLAPIVIVLKVKPGHVLYEQAERYLRQAIAEAGPLDRAEAVELLRAIRESAGEANLAGMYVMRSRHFVRPGTRIPKEPAAAGATSCCGP
jgi:hypothetical protein